MNNRTNNRTNEAIIGDVLRDMYSASLTRDEKGNVKMTLVLVREYVH